MEKRYFPLGAPDDNKLVKIFRIFFGIVCIIIGAVWIIINLKSQKTDWSLWITIVFLFAFGAYQIFSGAGLTTRYIIISQENIFLKKDAFFSAVRILPGELEKLEFFPLSLIFHFKSGKKLTLRLGTINYETNEKIIDDVIGFAGKNSIPYEIKEEKL